MFPEQFSHREPQSFRQQRGYGSDHFANKLCALEGKSGVPLDLQEARAFEIRHAGDRLNLYRDGLMDDQKWFSQIETTVVDEALRAHTLLRRLEENIQLGDEIGEEAYREKLTDAEVNLIVIKRIWSSMGSQAELDRYLRESWDLELRSRALLDTGLNSTNPT